MSTILANNKFHLRYVDDFLQSWKEYLEQSNDLNENVTLSNLSLCTFGLILLGFYF